MGCLPRSASTSGFATGIGEPLVIGSGGSGFPGQDAIMPGEFVLGYPDESGSVPPLPGREILTRNGSFLAFRSTSY